MNTGQVERFVMRFLEAYNCRIIEKTKHAVTVNLSPEADKELTGRSYYWSFVERTGVEPETMTYRFVFDPEGDAAAAAAARPTPGGPAAAGQPGYAVGASAPGGTPGPAAAGQPGYAAGTSAPGSAPGPAAAGQPGYAAGASAPGGSPGPAAPELAQDTVRSADSILGRYFGTAPAPPIGRVPRDEVTYGSRRLQQLFQTALGSGRFTRLFEVIDDNSGQFRNRAIPLTYCTWMNVNFKVEFACDMKRSEIHSLAINMTTGDICEEFHPYMLTKQLAPKLPANIHLLGDNLTLSRAASALESYLEQKIRRTDHSWADRANDILAQEHQLVRLYYEGMLAAAEPEAREEIETRYSARQAEVDWQYRPRVLISVINCGLFHLKADGR
ncbi:YqhG family protein [Paenibacillus sp. FJAT-26967]|uniref:YqhG family protein n=1 Tax=Paenibacillus sp. FJAT-26967 TaxID=1729690 RepID=UPI000838F82C|nr:YqhG family protein [Paenibacillus sp. FJAT-26967]